MYLTCYSILAAEIAERILCSVRQVLRFSVARGLCFCTCEREEPRGGGVRVWIGLVTTCAIIPAPRIGRGTEGTADKDCCSQLSWTGEGGERERLSWTGEGGERGCAGGAREERERG